MSLDQQVRVAGRRAMSSISRARGRDFRDAPLRQELMAVPKDGAVARRDARATLPAPMQDAGWS